MHKYSGTPVGKGKNVPNMVCRGSQLNKNAEATKNWCCKMHLIDFTHMKKRITEKRILHL